jgi:hypothetical protein
MEERTDASNDAKPQKRVPMTLERLQARYARMKEQKRAYQARRYENLEFRALKCSEAKRRYHERVPTARYNNKPNAEN